MRTAFRIATLTIEIIERRKISFDKAFNLAVKKVEKIELSQAYRLAWRALTKYMLSDNIIMTTLGKDIPLRRKCAFRVGFFLVYYEHLHPEVLKRISGGLLPGRFIDILKRIRKEDEYSLLPEGPEDLVLAIKYSHPRWLVHKLKLAYGGDLINILKANEKRVIWLRVNKFKADEDRVEKLLDKENVKFTKDKDIPGLYRLDESEVVPSNLEVVRRNLAIIQDKASILVVYALRPEKHDLILDACAAPGMKTLLILEMLNRSGRIVALDISRKRTISMKYLLKKYYGDATNVDILTTDSSNISFLKKFDKALVDAPCTNSGAINSDPALRIILRDTTDVDIKRLKSIQTRILTNSLKYSDKYVIYSTCSIIPDECEDIIRHIKNLRYKIDKIELEVGSTGYGFDDVAKKSVRLLPIHGTAGFFISKVRP